MSSPPSALAQIVLFVAFVLGMGLVSAVAPLAAQAFGARQPRMVRRALRVGFWAALMLGIPLTVGAALRRRDPARARADAGSVGARRALSARPRLVHRAGLVVHRVARLHGRGEPARARALDHACGDPGQLRCSPMRLIYGEFGLPRLDVLGAGIATTIVNIGMCVAGFWVCYACRPFKKYRVLGRFWRMDWPLMGQLVRRSARRSPASFLLEYGLFAAAALLMGWISHHRARRASDRAHDRLDHVHGAVRHLDGGDRAGRPRGRRAAMPTATRAPASPRSRSAPSSWRRWRCSRSRRATSFRSRSSDGHAGSDATAVARGHAARWSARASSSPTACRPSRPARCAA